MYIFRYFVTENIIENEKKHTALKKRVPLYTFSPYTNTATKVTVKL